MRSRLPWLPVALAATALLTAGRADAQQWLSDRTRAEGRGISVGDLKLHPGIGSELGWVSNVFLVDPAQASATLRITPHLYLSTADAAAYGGSTQPTSNGGLLAEPVVGFRAGVNGVLKTYFGNGPDHDPDMGVGQDARLLLRPSRIFHAEFFEDYRRTIDPFSVTPTTGATTAGAPATAGTTSAKPPGFDRDLLGAGTRLQVSSSGGLLKAGLGYRFDLDKFEDGSFKTNDNLTHTISVDDSWEFLPQTALIWRGSVGLHKFTDAAGSRAARNSSTTVSTLFGLNGALTSRIAATLGVGYTAFFSADKADYDTVAAQVEVRWTIRSNLQWSVGYDRQINPSFQGNFSRLDRARTRLQTMLLGKLLIALRGDVTFLTFGADPLDGTQSPRQDINLVTNLSGEYRFVDWLALTGELGYIRNFTDYTYPVSMAKASYQQFAAFIGLRAFL
jgi:hypothetical protein